MLNTKRKKKEIKIYPYIRTHTIDEEQNSKIGLRQNFPQSIDY